MERGRPGKGGAKADSRSDPLLPELAAWNGGNGIRTLNWLCTFATSAAALAYLRLFWPTFVSFDGYMFTKGFDVAAVRSMEAVPDRSRSLVESLVNRVDLAELFTLNDNEPWTEVAKARTVAIGRILQQAYHAKLRADFPDREFAVELLDGSDEGASVAITFWQV